MFYEDELVTLEGRKKLIEYVEHKMHDDRKNKSIAMHDVFKGKLLPLVKEQLQSSQDKSTVNEMQIVSSVNMCKKVISEEATIYRNEPERKFNYMTEEQIEVIRETYRSMRVSKKLLKSNKYYKLEHQGLIKVVPNLKTKKQEIQILKRYQYTPILDFDGVTPIGYVIPNYSNVNKSDKGKARKDKTFYTVWTERYNYLMDGNGEFVGESDEKDILNQIGVLPFVEVVGEDKDFDYWVDEERGLASFTVEFNAALTELLHVMRMQGFSQLAIVAHQDTIDAVGDMQFGLNKVLFIPKKVDIDGNETTADVNYLNANPDLAGSIEVISTLVSAFLTSENQSPNTVSLKGQKESYSSALERLLALFEKYEASVEDYKVYREVEEEIFKLMVKWHNLNQNAENPFIDSKYIAKSQISEDATLTVKYEKPEMVQTQSEKDEREKTRETNGWQSRVISIKNTYGYESEDEAVEHIIKNKELDMRAGLVKVEETQGDEGEDLEDEQ